MVVIQQIGDQVVFEVQGWDKLWSLSSKLSIPAANIVSAKSVPGVEMKWFDALKLAGTGVPTLFRAGAFLQHSELVFWDVRNREKAIIVTLEHERYKKLIIEVADPAQAVALLNGVAGAARG